MFAYFSDKVLILLFVGLIVLGPALIAVIGVALAITGHKERALNKRIKREKNA